MATRQPDAKSFKADTRLAYTHKDEIQELQDELASMNPPDAVPSSVEYYQSTKDQSYPVNPANVQRGRAIVVSMTENREGWKEDVRALHRLFLSLSIHTEHVFDPDTEELINRLTLFAKSEENKHVDCIFVILMGHGYGQGANTFLQTKSKGFEIWSNCSKIFNESAHHLNEKPKIFLAQVCRGQQTVDPVKVENPPARPLEDHLLVFASQPGEFAQRDARGSRFVQQFTNVLPDYSHKMHVEGMIKIVRQIFAAVNRVSSTSKQMCQVWTTTIYDVNLFPGIKESKLEPVETIDVRNAGPVEGSKADPRVVSLEYQVPTGNGPDLQLKVRGYVLPEDPEKAALIEKELVLKCQNQEFINGLSQCLSREIGSHISVKNVTTGSFTLHCNMTNYAIIDYIKYLCDTDIIGNTLERLLVTNELKASHHVNHICLNASIEENSYNEILQFLEACRIPRMPTRWQMEDHEAYLADDVSIECEANGEVQWYKNGSRLRVNPRITINKDNGKSCLKIKGACMADGGFYECHQFAPKHTITKCRLVVYDYGCPSDVRATPLSSQVASVTWKAASGNVTGYKVFYHLTIAPEIHGIVAVGGQKTETCDITNLLPGQEYSLSVVSLNGPFESRVPETGTFSLKLPTLQQALVETFRPVLQKSLNAVTEKCVIYLMQQNFITEDEGNIILHCKSEEAKTDALVELLKTSKEELLVEFLVTLYEIQQADTADFLCSLHLNPSLIRKEIERMRDQLQSEKVISGAQEDHPEQAQATSSVMEESPSHFKLSDTRVSQYVMSLPGEEDAETVRSYPATVVSKDSGISSGKTPVNPKARVTESYKAADDAELTLEVGDLVTVTDQLEGDMWKGDLRGEEGLFPHKCVKVINLQSAETKERLEGEEALRKEIKELIKAQGTKTSELKTLNDHILELSKLCNSTAASAGRAEEVGMVFDDRQWLVIWKKKESKSVSPELPAARWRAVQDTLLPQHVKGVLIHVYTVKLGSSTESVLDFTSKCNNLESFQLVTPPGVKVDQKATVQGLVAIGKHLHDLVEFDVRDTPLGTGWQDVLSAVSWPHLQVLSLISNKLSGCGQHLADCLARLPLLSLLQLSNSGLSGEGLVAVLGSLPTSCPHLVALLVGNNTLPDQGAALSSAVKNLPKLKLLTFGNCKLLPKSQFSIMQNCNERIELLNTCYNDSFTKKENVLGLVQQRPRLLYLQVSPYQLSPGNQEQLATLLQDRGGRFIVGGPADPGWQQYKNYVNKVADECRIKL